METTEKKGRMETLEVGQGLVELCKQGKFLEAIGRYYDEDIVSIEGASMPGLEKRMEGIDQIKQKNQWWQENHEIHDFSVEGPFVSEGSDEFAVRFFLDVTNKPSGQRFKAPEVGLYTVKDGKVVKEQFFFAPQQ